MKATPTSRRITAPDVNTTETETSDHYPINLIEHFSSSILSMDSSFSSLNGSFRQLRTYDLLDEALRVSNAIDHNANSPDDPVGNVRHHANIGSRRQS